MLNAIRRAWRRFLAPYSSLESKLSSGTYPRPWYCRLILWLYRRPRVWRYRYWEFRFRRDKPPYAERALVFAAYARCRTCSAGMAYHRGIGMRGAWDCSAVLTGQAADPENHEHLPFMFYEVKSENQPSARGATTRRPPATVPKRSAEA